MSKLPILAAIRTVAEGLSYSSHEVSMMLLEHFGSAPGTRASSRHNVQTFCVGWCTILT